MKALSAAAAILLVVRPVTAQNATAVDVSQKSVGIYIGLAHSSSLWSIGGQAISLDVIHQDTISFNRKLASGLSLGFQYTSFVSQHFALAFEASYINYRFTDRCQLTFAAGDTAIASACDIANGVTSGSGGSVAFHGGVVWRPLAKSVLQPFAKATIGVATVARSSAEVVLGKDITGNDRFRVYNDASWQRVRKLATVSLGVKTAANSGLAVFVESRETFVSLPLVTGTNPLQNAESQHRTSFIGNFSVLAGADFVLKRARGKRY